MFTDRKSSPKHPLRLVTILLAACGVVAALLAVTHHPGDTPHCSKQQRKDLKNFRRQIQGVVVYQRESAVLQESIYKTVVGNPRAVLLARDGRYPRWSPDGRHIAFLRRNKVMLMDSSGRHKRVLAEAGEARAIAFHPNGHEVLFTDRNSIKAVDTHAGAVRTLLTGEVFVNVDLSPDATRLLTSARGHEVLAYDLLPTNTTRRVLSAGCSTSLSPDGRLLLHNTGGHIRFLVRDWESGSVTNTLSAPAGYQSDNSSWSNDPDWIACRTETPRNHPPCEDIYLIHVTSNAAYRVTFTADGNRPDLYVWSHRPGLFTRLHEVMEAW